MKKSALLVVGILCSIVFTSNQLDCGAAAQTERTASAAGPSIAAEPNVTVTLRLASGRVTVRGWHRNEVSARALGGEHIELRRDGAAHGSSKPAGRLLVIVGGEPAAGAGAKQHGKMSPASGVELNIPQSASVQLRIQSGDVRVTGVAEARVEAASGDVWVEGVAGVVDATSISGSISVRDSGGRIRLTCISGNVNATNVRPVAANDDFEAQTTSGDVDLDGVGHARVEAESVSGSLTFSGPLVPGGRYDLNTLSGDVALLLPGDASFQVDARVSGGKINTDFPLRLTGDAARSSSLRLTGAHGSGDATLNLASFSGTVRLRRK